jgi:cobalt-zinc-cadmium resistance protein CzcA
MRAPQFLLRPGLWWVLYTVLALAGVYALWVAPVEVLPRFDYPQIRIVVHSPGESAHEMETLIVRPLEGEIQGLTDLVSLRATMGEGTAELTARFAEGDDPQFELQAVYSAIARARASLPDGVTPYAEVMGNAVNEVADYAVEIPPGVSPARVQRLIETRILPSLRAIDGVQLVNLFGSGDESLWIQPNPVALRTHGVGMAALVNAVRAHVLLGPAGRLSLGHQDVLIEARSLPVTAEALRRIAIPTATGSEPLDALAWVVRQGAPVHYAVRLNDAPSLGLVVFKQAGASTRPVTRSVRETLHALQSQLPKGVIWRSVYDQGHVVSLIGGDLGRNLLVGGVLAIGVLFWVLGAHRGVWGLALSVPLVLVIAIAALYALGHSLNLLTLGALTVAVGLLADDGIIVLEAIHHRWETGLLGMDAIHQGLRDIAGPDISGTLTTVATYLPLLAVGGLAGLFSVPFAFAMSLALLVSLLVSLTLIPLIASRQHPPPAKITGSGPRALAGLRAINERVLAFTLRRPRMSLLASVVLCFVSIGALLLVPVNFLPLPNEGVLLDSFTLPPGTSLDQTTNSVSNIVATLRADPAVARVYSRIGSAGDTAYVERSFAGELEIVLKPSVGTASLDAISARLLNKAKKPGVEQSIGTPTLERLGESLSGLPQPFVVELYGAHLDTLRTLSNEVVKRLQTVPQLSDIFNNDAYPVTQLRIEPRVEAMRAFDITPRDLYAQLAPAWGGTTIAQVPDGDYRLRIYVRLADATYRSIDALSDTLIRTGNGWTPLHMLATLNLVSAPNQVRHTDGERAIDILATPTGPLGSTIAAARQALEGLAIPEGYRVGFGGLFPQMEHTAVVLGLAAIGAFLLMFAILSLHFGGVRVPFILLCQLPLAFTGGALALAISGVGLNAIGLVGFLTLIGIGLNHGIVLLHRARSNEADGMAPETAIRDAVHVRFRPIFLTTLTAVLGMLPTAMGWGLGAEPEQGLAVVILGGILWSSLLSTNLLPALYLHWHPKPSGTADPS